MICNSPVRQTLFTILLHATTGGSRRPEACWESDDKGKKMDENICTDGIAWGRCAFHDEVEFVDGHFYILFIIARILFASYVYAMVFCQNLQGVRIGAWG